jgi:LPS export ABC transporter protein LptC
MSGRRFDRPRTSVLDSAGTLPRVRASRRTFLRRAARWAAAALWLGASGCGSKTATSHGRAEVRVPDQEARDFTLTESSEGKKNWTLWATYAAMYTDRNLIDARTVRIEFYDAKGAKFSTLLADQGVVDQRTNDLEARGHVRIATETGIRMETDSLRWLNDRQRIVSNAFVRVMRKYDIVTGWGFESDASLDHFHLAREVQAEVRDEGGRGDSLLP